MKSIPLIPPRREEPARLPNSPRPSSPKTDAAPSGSEEDEGPEAGHFVRWGGEVYYDQSGAPRWGINE